MVALVTPMSEQGDICYTTLESLINWHVQASTDALVILGTTGESSLVDEEEYYKIASFALEKCDGRIPVILGCGAISTDKTVALAKRLSELGPDGFLCVTPYYVKPSQEGLVTHFRQIADATEVPVILYNVPGRTGVDLCDESILALSKHPNIVGLKDATGDIARGAHLIKQLPSFSFLSGDDETALEYVKQGGDGAISVTANIAPEEMSRWINEIREKQSSGLNTDEDIRDAAELFQWLMPLYVNLFIEANPIPVKWALWRMGKIEQGIRLPLTWLNTSNQQTVEDALVASQIIKVVE